MISNKVLNKESFINIKVFFSDVDGTLTDGCTYYSVKGEEMKKFNHKDGRGNYLLRQNRIKFGIITGEKTMIVEQRADKIKADFCFLNIQDKLSFMQNFCKENGLRLNEIAFIGDDTNDLELIKNVGLSFAVNDAMVPVTESAHYICTRNGGNGAFREAVDFLISSIKLNQ